MISNVLGSKFHRFSLTQYPFEHSLKISGETSSKPSNFISRLTAILLILGYFIGFSGNTQANISVDAMDPRAKGESTNKAYTDDEIKWRVGYETQTGGSAQPKIELELSGKNSLCDGEIRIPPGWQVDTNTDTSPGDNGNIDYSGIDQADIDSINNYVGEIIDPNKLIDEHECQETQHLTMSAPGWVSENPGIGIILKKPSISTFEIGNTGGDGYIPFVHDTNGRIYMTYHYGSVRLQCVDVNTGQICDGYIKDVVIGPVDNVYYSLLGGYSTDWEYNHFVGDKLFFPANIKDHSTGRLRFGIGCFHVNSPSPAEAGACDGKNGRELFGNNGYRELHQMNWKNLPFDLVGPIHVNGKLFAYSNNKSKLYCYDPGTGDSCGSPYPKNLSNDGISALIAARGSRALAHNNKIYLFTAKSHNDSIKSLCWDTVNHQYCWNPAVATLPTNGAYGYHGDTTIPYISKRYDESGLFDGVCVIHQDNNGGACVKADTGEIFPEIDNDKNRTFGVPNILKPKLTKYMEGKNVSKTIRLKNKLHGRTYYVNWYGGEGGVWCWDWTANDFCFHYDNQENQVSFGENGFLRDELSWWEYGVAYDSTYGCFWTLGHLNFLWSFDAEGNIPCNPSAFSATRYIDPELLYCASGAPIGWKWNSIELYDFVMSDWDRIEIALLNWDSGEELIRFDDDSHASLFVQKENHINIDLKGNPTFNNALRNEKRLKIKFIGIASDANVIRNNRAPTIITTIDKKKPIEFCINALTEEGKQGCGVAKLRANLDSANDESGSNQSGVQVVEYTPDPESHTQPTLYVNQGKEDGFGIIVRPYIYPVLKQGSDIEVNGISTVQALFVTTEKVETDFDEDTNPKQDAKKLFFMEDTNLDGELDVDDKRIVYSPNDKHGMGAKIGTNSSIQHFNEVKPLWDAHIQLDQVSNEDVLVQRDYTDTDSKRYIFTWLDDRKNGSNSSHALDGIVHHNEVIDFTEDMANESNKGLFKDSQGGDALISVDKVKSIIRFVRGDSRVKPGEVEDDEKSERGIVGYRERRIIPPKRTSQETFRLGGLRHSKALIVGAPQHSHMSSRYNGDNDYMVDWAQARDLDNYRQFKDKYKNRRLMVYVGGNDGMIHAFNSGFIDFENRSIDTQSSTNSSAINWPLGKEVWAYVPRAVLPYLYDLTHPLYKPRYYIDGNPLAFDVRLFSHSTTHPGGWATILVVPMRMGGGFAEVELSSGEIGDITPVYVVLDITNPEKEPKLLAEITHQDLGFTTSEPTIVYETVDDELIPYLVFGSGPTNSTFALSDKVGKVYMYDLIDDNLLVRATLPTSNDADGNPIPIFAGDMKAINLRSAFTGSQINSVSDETLLATDVVYFGVSSGSDVRKLGGSIMRLNKNQTTKELSKLETLLEPKVNSDDSDHPGGRPIVYAPTVSVSFEGKRDELWVYAGTGRLLVDADESNIEQQYVLGIIEKSNYDDSISTNFPSTVGSSDIKMTKLVDVTEINVESNGALAEDSRNISGLESGITNERQLAQRIINDDDGDQVDGWLRRLTLFKTGSGDNELVAQSGRITGRVGIVRNQLIVSEFLPPTLDLVDQCQPSGKQIFYRFAKDNGTADETVLTEFTVTDASLNDADFIDWDGDLGVGAGSTTRLDPEDFYGLGGDGKRIRWREVEEIK